MLLSNTSKSTDSCVLQDFADSVSQLVTQKFRELTVGLTSVYARHKPLAGIVMTKGNYLSFPVAIFVSTERNVNINLVLGV